MAITKSILMTSAIALAFSLAHPAIAAGAGMAPAVASDDGSGIADIIVTARKRSESAQSVPVAISAFSADTLRQKQITSFADVAEHTSGVTMQVSSSTQQFSVVIRGQNVLDSSLNLDPAIGLYVDGVYIGPDTGNAVALNFDDAVGLEVLKGPQGTLYGRNTSGGALKLDHVVPDYKIAGWVKTELGNYDMHAIRGAVTLPIVDDLATVRLYGRYSKRDGYGRNIDTGADVNDDRTYSLGGTLRLDPAANVNIILRGNYDNSHSGGLSIRPTGIIPTTNFATLSIAATNGLPITADSAAPLKATLSPEAITQATGLFFSTGPKSFYDTAGRFPTPNDVKLGSASATINVDISEALQIKSITGFRNIKANRSLNFSGQSTSLVLVANPYHYRQWSEELTFSGTLLDEKLDYTAGLFYLNGKGHDATYVAVAPALATVLPTSLIPTAQNDGIGDQITKSYAAYAQATYEIVAGLHFTGGLRYTKEDKNLTTHNKVVFGTYNSATGYVDVGPEVPFTGTSGNTVCFETNQGVGNACSAKQPFTFKKVTWLGSIDYRVTRDILVYGKVSRGFRSGGGQLRLGAGLASANGVPPFGPEVVNDVEIGVKADLLDGKLRTNLALFRDVYTGMQRTIQVVLPQSGLNNIVSSAGKSRVQGVEFDLLFKPAPQITLGWSGAYTDPKYISYVDGLGNDLSQQRFQGVAKFVSTVSAAYRTETGFGSVGWNVDYFHTSSVPLSPGAGTASFGGPSNTNPWAVQKGYGLLNSRLEANIGDSWTLGAWVKNLANKKYFTYNLDSTASLGFASSWGGTPRTWGADATMRF